MKELIYLIFTALGLAFGASWQDGVDIKSVLKQHELEKLLSFQGDGEEDLRLLSLSGNSVFIGGKDAFHNLTLQDEDNHLIHHSTGNWNVSKEYQETCQFKGQLESKCHNFIRVLHGPVGVNSNRRSSADSSSKRPYLMCGTNAFKPTCRWYSADLRSHGKDFSGVGYSPFDPAHVTSSLLHQEAVYAATVADFGGTDSLIYKQPLRTEQYYDLQLNSPSFVSSRSLGEEALFFFRELAVEHSNCGKRVYSRVGRICGGDNGGRKQKDRFTSFLKARLNCSIPGQFPFYFDHIQDTTEIFKNAERGNEQMLYAVFTTGGNSIGASAVCSFYTKEILKAFEGPFKGQTTLQSNWLPVPPNQVPAPRPGRCAQIAPTLHPDSNSAAFLKGHPLMDDAVQGTVVLTTTSNQDKFLSVTVDHSSQVAPYHVLYIGTESGKVLKAVVGANPTSSDVVEMKNVISQSWELFTEGVKSVELLGPKRLLVLTQKEMIVTGTENCERFSSCDKCLEIRDPHCGWDTVTRKCVSKYPLHPDKERDEGFLQDLSDGDTNLCDSTDIAKSNEISQHRQDLLKTDIDDADDIQAEECCSCPTTPSSTIPIQIQSNNFLRQTNHTKLNSNHTQGFETQVEPRIEPKFQNPSSHIENNLQQDFEPYYVKSNQDLVTLVSSQSIIVATTSSAILSLFVGFSLGFLMCKWMVSRQNKKSQKSSTNAQLSVNESQRLTKPIDILVNVPTLNINDMKNDLNATVPDKTAKKIYL